MRGPSEQVAGTPRPERRSGRRLRVSQRAQIVLPHAVIDCEVRDLSTQGAKIALRQEVTLPETFRLFIAAQSLRTYSVRLRWHKGNQIGISFEMDA
ncbi:PilZ domain-containing protein [Microvirga massiliensis]|uniref:PilZ domain-containing protein n=1 Tax=Microvirga massiliensis TaxID=1033741 RepID=UPI00062B6705|nr:PilZ domain-containing protein [Microvirga massiliensis]